MPKISLTDFVDIVSSSGVPKATRIRQIKSRGDYQPQFDFYKPLREAIQAMHRSGAPKSDLDKVLALLKDAKKLTNYPAAIKGYKKWIGSDAGVWFEPPKAELARHGVEVSVNPEIGLEKDGARQIIKLYFKATPLTKSRADIVTCAMEDTLGNLTESGDTVGVLDVRRGKVFWGSGADPLVMNMVAAELAYIAALWSQLK
jgi:hypothetical protein